MTDINHIIASLSAEVASAKPARSPARWGRQLAAVLAVYAVLAQAFSGMRADVEVMMLSPTYLVGLLLLLAILVSATLAAITAMAPDLHQRRWLLRLPYALAAAFAAWAARELLRQQGIVWENVQWKEAQCTLCIAGMAALPSAYFVYVLKHGASVLPRQAMALAVLASSALGCAILQLSEATNSMQHLVLWHYAPTVLFALLGAAMGRHLLRW